MRGDALPHASPGLGVCVWLTVGSNAVLGARGAQWGEKFGWERPNFFCPGASEDEIQRLKEYSYGHGNWMEAVGKEADACRNSVAIFDQSSFSKFAVQGRDAAQVTHVPPLSRVCPSSLITHAMLGCRRRCCGCCLCWCGGLGGCTVDCAGVEPAVCQPSGCGGGPCGVHRHVERSGWL